MPATVDTSGTSSGEPSVLVDALGESFQARDPLVDRRGRAEKPDAGGGGQTGPGEQALGRGPARSKGAPPLFHPPALPCRSQRPKAAPTLSPPLVPPVSP